MKASGLPKPSTKIFVFLPPLDMPAALFSLFPAVRALMYLARCGIYGDVLKVGIHGQGLKYCFKNSFIPPFPKTAVYCLPWAISLRQFSPGCPSSGNPQDPIHCAAVIAFRRASPFPFLWVFWRQKLLDPFPLTFCEFISFCSHTISLHEFKPLCKFLKHALIELINCRLMVSGAGKSPGCRCQRGLSPDCQRPGPHRSSAF